MSLQVLLTGRGPPERQRGQSGISGIQGTPAFRGIGGICAIAGALGLCAAAASPMAHAAPAQMRAIVEHGTGGPEVVHLERIPVPDPGADQVRVRVVAAGINPADWEIRTGMFGGARRGGAAGPPRDMYPGLEFAGVIDAVGSNVTRWKAGQGVYGTAAPGSGAYAQYVLANADSIALKPRRLSFEQAAGAPVGALTALRTLDDGHVQAGQTVVVIGAAGGVGSAVVQLAKARGATVIAVASSRHNAYLERIGADRVVNYDRGTPDLHDVDVVINTAQGQAAAALAYLKRGGVMVSIVGPPLTDAQCAAAGVSCPNQMRRRAAVDTSAQLAEVAKLADAGKFTVYVEKTYPLAQAAEAQEFNRAGHAEGKVVLVVATARQRR